MKIEQALGIMSKSAKKYKDNLENQNILFIFGQMKDGQPDLTTATKIETLFLSENFMHLTGNANRRISANLFYRRALASILTKQDYHFSKDGSSFKKLSVIETLMNIDQAARLIGDFNEHHVNLYTEKLVGTTNVGSMGFITPRENPQMLVPNTLLKGDIRDLTKQPRHTIFAIYKKHRSEIQYTQHTYLHKFLDESQLSEILLDKH